MGLPKERLAGRYINGSILSSISLHLNKLQADRPLRGFEIVDLGPQLCQSVSLSLVHQQCQSVSLTLVHS